MVYYRTSDGQADYGFSIERQSDNTWRAYITAQPSYRGRAEGAAATHRLTDNGRQYVCWTNPIRSESDARQVAARWANCTQEYIRTGNFAAR